MGQTQETAGKGEKGKGTNEEVQGVCPRGTNCLWEERRQTWPTGK